MNSRKQTPFWVVVKAWSTWLFRDFPTHRAVYTFSELNQSFRCTGPLPNCNNPLVGKVKKWNGISTATEGAKEDSHTIIHAYIPYVMVFALTIQSWFESSMPMQPALWSRSKCKFNVMRYKSKRTFNVLSNQAISCEFIGRDSRAKLAGVWGLKYIIFER